MSWKVELSQQPQKICTPGSRRDQECKLAKVFKKRWAHALLRLFRAGGSGACLQASVSKSCLASAGVVPQPCNRERKTGQHSSQFRATTKKAKPTKPNRLNWHRTPLTSSSSEVTLTSFLLDMEPRCHILSIYTWKRTRLLADSCPLCSGLLPSTSSKRRHPPHLSKQVSLTFFYNYEWTIRSYRKSIEIQ